jgi:hypothetical protein
MLEFRPRVQGVALIFPLDAFLKQECTDEYEN